MINRGDSFKRSFKRSNNSISSKKDTGINYYEGSNTLNLPDFQDAYNKSSNNSSNYGLNETSFSHDATASFSENIEIKPSEKQTEKVEPKIFLVYVVGSTGVGKNALIKQFKTSEYRGTYDITASLSGNLNKKINFFLPFNSNFCFNFLKKKNKMKELMLCLMELNQFFNLYRWILIQ